MRKILDFYYRINNWLVFIVIILVYYLALTIEFNFVFTDEFYKKSFESIKSLDSITNLINAERSVEWVNYIIVFIIILVPTLLISFIINMGFILKEVNVKFIQIFQSVLKAQIIFALNYLLSVILKWFGIVERNFENINNNYDYQSLLVFFKDRELPYWLTYTLQCINITEILFILFLGFGLKLLINTNYKKALIITLVFYGSALIIWIIFTIFLKTILYG